MPADLKSQPARIDDFRDPDRRIWAIAGPAMLANISAPLVGLVDTWAIGHLPDPKHLAAIGVGATIFSFVLWSFGFLRMGTTSLVAQSVGRGRRDEVASHSMRALMVGFGLGFAVLLLSGPLLSLGLVALSPPEEVRTPLADYYNIRVLAVPVTLMTYAMIGQLIGEARARAALVMQLVLNILNAALNLLFVLKLDMGVTGIALGTVLAELVTLLVGFYLILKGGRLAYFRQAIAPSLFDRTQLLRLFKVNGSLFVRTLLLITALALMTEQSARLGTVALAASQVLNIFLLLISLGLDAFAYAAEALVGQAAGRRDRVTFRFWMLRTGLWAGLAALVYVALFWAFGTLITAQLTALQSVRDAIETVMPLLVLLPLVGVASYHFDGVYIGAGATGAMAVTMLIAVTGYVLALEPLAARFGIAGIWCAVGVLLALRGLGQAIWYPKIEPPPGSV